MEHVLEPQPLTAEAFSPYGVLITGNAGIPTFERPYLKNWRLPFNSDAPVRMQVMRYEYQSPMLFSKVERHLYVTEARCPINAAKAILVVAGDGKTPAPLEIKSVKAFYLDGSAGVMFYPGTWHGLDCYPVDSPYADFMFLSDAKTEDEIESLINPVSGERTQVYDFSLQQTSFKVVTQ